ncbi:MAG TPA: hypothetical protein VM122_08365, partial [Usitatibacter sp.]|nr:hypothetical protein [Usitatibacter sp.]
RTDRALAAYTALHERFVGFEAKYRYARLLKRLGREAEAKEMFNVVAANARRSALESEQEWVKLAQRELAQNTADA